MFLLSKLKQKFFPPKTLYPADAYNIWANEYDDQPGNLVMAEDERLLQRFLLKHNLTGSVIADIGCGTGRHWHHLLAKKPSRLIGYDVSQKMLEELRKKISNSETYILNNHHLGELQNGQCDFIISTLTVAHLETLLPVFAEWMRVLKPGGIIYITDYHPAMLQKGGKRTFKKSGKVFEVKNYIHTIEQIRDTAKQFGAEETYFEEVLIDNRLKHYFETGNALQNFNKFSGTPVLYALCLKKQNGSA